MISTAIALAILTTGGFLIIYQKFPPRLRKFIQKHPLISDMVALLLIYVLLGGTLTALIAASICGLFVSMLLHVANNKQEFLYLFDLYDILASMGRKTQSFLKRSGEAYRVRRS
jgi:hypothetical protein